MKSLQPDFRRHIMHIALKPMPQQRWATTNRCLFKALLTALIMPMFCQRFVACHYQRIAMNEYRCGISSAAHKTRQGLHLHQHYVRIIRFVDSTVMSTIPKWKTRRKVTHFYWHKNPVLFIEDEVPDYLPTLQTSIKQICFHTFPFELNAITTEAATLKLSVNCYTSCHSGNF